MGRDFQKELGYIPDTIRQCFSWPIPPQFYDLIGSLSPFPLLVVGSGGSYSAAHFIARLHEQVTGHISKAITPLDLFSSELDPSRHAVLLLSASGGNKDFLRTLEIAIEREFAISAIICAQIGSKASKKTVDYPHLKIFEYANPAGKDGFLAVNSLLSTCILAARGYGSICEDPTSYRKLGSGTPDFRSSDWHETLDRKTIVAVGGGWAWPALIDFESKVAEAALTNVFISDLRNFGHGRHQWFEKRGKESALLVIETVPFVSLSKKTQALLPSEFPRAVLRSALEGPMAGIDLLIQIFRLVGEIGMRVGIDPGRPKVPEYGRKIYSLGLNPVLHAVNSKNHAAWIKRKLRVTGMAPSLIEKSLQQFIKKLKSTSFSAVVFDYDGTLCDPPERFTRPKPEMGDALNSLLAERIVIGVATGRGRSVQRGLREIVDSNYWSNVIVGNYNGSVVQKLSSELPRSDPKNLSDNIRRANEILRNDLVLKEHCAKFETRERQISVSPATPFSMQKLLEIILERLKFLSEIKIFQSGHSIDVIDSGVSKIVVVQETRSLIDKGGDTNILVIGDQGHHSGNDFEMLKEPFSISVDRISSSLSTCWNLSPVGTRGAKATLAILNSLRKINGSFHIDTHFLENGGA